MQYFVVLITDTRSLFSVEEEELKKGVKNLYLAHKGWEVGAQCKDGQRTLL